MECSVAVLYLFFSKKTPPFAINCLSDYFLENVDVIDLL